MTRGAGGTEGGLGQFIIGFIMMCAGFYMLLNAIHVNYNFGMGMNLFSFSLYGSRFSITNGMVLIPFIFGVGMIFYNSKNPIGWLLAIGSISSLLFGVISTVNFTLRRMTAFDLITILVLSVGGLGLFLRSLKNYSDNE